MPQVARTLGLDPVAAAIAVIRVDDPRVASFNQTEEDIAAFMRQPWVMTGSDASDGHPRAYRQLRAQICGICAPAECARACATSSSAARRSPADTFGLADRGRLRPGAFADIVVFDPEAYAARATYEEPTLLAAGVRTVLVNGVPAVDNGALTGAAAGRGLAQTPPAGSCQ